MSCLTCAFTNPVPVCTQEIVLGTISEVNTAVYVFVENLTTGQSVRYSASSDALGIVRLDTSQIQFDEEFNYNFYITLQTSNPSLRELLTIDGVAASCWTVEFFDLLSDTGQKIQYPSIELQFCQS